MKKVSIIRAGSCAPHITDCQLLITYLTKNGWVLARGMDNADIIIITTCAFKKEQENLAIRIIKKAQREKKDGAKIIVAGCLPVINKNRLSRVFKGDTVKANRLQELDRLLDAKISISDIKYIGYPRRLKTNESIEYNLRIGWGCDEKCSYCAVRFVFGKPHSRPITDILQEFDNAYLKGYRNFMLVANDSGSYGQDINLSLVYLLDRIMKQHRDCHFSLSHLNPNKFKELLPDLERFIRSRRIYAINIPVESGSSRILKLMNRFYTVKDFKYCVKKISGLNPKLTIMTDILVGFPSETEDDFSKTLKLIEWLGRHKVFFQCLGYSKRPNAEASLMPGQIDYGIKQARVRKLNKLCQLSYVMRDKNLFMQSKRRTMPF